MNNASQPDLSTAVIHPAVNYETKHTVGVIPGSSRYFIKDYSYTQLSDLQGNLINFNYAIGSGTAVDGKACFFEFVCTARNEDDSPIDEADQLALEHGAGALLISDITSGVGTAAVTHLARNDLTRYTTDVFAGEQRRRALGGANYYADQDAGVLDTTNPSFAASQKRILGGRQFKLIHWLDHLPMFGQTDPHIPGPSTIQLNIQFTNAFSRLFKALTTSPVVGTTPKLYISQARVHIRTSELDPRVVPQILQTLGSGAGVGYNTIVNKAMIIQPGVLGPATEYNTRGNPTEVPGDEILRQISLFMMDTVRTNLSVPYIHTRWNFLTQAKLGSESGGELRVWRNMVAGKAALFAELGSRTIIPTVGSEGAPQFPFNYWNFDQQNAADADEGALYAYLTGWFDDEVAIQEPRFRRLWYDLSFQGTTTNTDVVIVTSTHKVIRIGV